MLSWQIPFREIHSSFSELCCNVPFLAKALHFLILHHCITSHSHRAVIFVLCWGLNQNLHLFNFRYSYSMTNFPADSLSSKERYFFYFELLSKAHNGELDKFLQCYSDDLGSIWNEQSPRTLQPRNITWKPLDNWFYSWIFFVFCLIQRNATPLFIHVLDQSLGDLLLMGMEPCPAWAGHQGAQHGFKMCTTPLHIVIPVLWWARFIFF